jgi:hypothetical protein
VLSSNHHYDHLPTTRASRRVNDFSGSLWLRISKQSGGTSDITLLYSEEAKHKMTSALGQTFQSPVIHLPPI